MEQNYLDPHQTEEIQLITSLINAFAVSDGFSDLEDCLSKHPDRLDTYTRYGAAAIRAVRYVQENPIRIVIDDSEEEVTAQGSA